MSKTIVVLGASQGIGAALVNVFAANSSNQVYALSRQLDKMQQQFQQANVYPLQLDLLTDVHDQIAALALPDKIDIVINNAGLLINKPFETITHQDFHNSYQVNVIGIMEATQALLPKLSAGSHIVNISSMGGFQGSLKFAGLAAYSTAKAALCSFTEMFAEEYKESGIHMNCLCLGAVQTEMLAQAFPGYQAPTTPEEMAKYIANFAEHSGQLLNGKIIPVSASNP
jgi:NAD(P)-dependent dehydrogenase (short-subunit alcohol dehydrogenase family)